MANPAPQKPGLLASLHPGKQQQDQLPSLGAELTIPPTTLSAHWLYQNEQRLDASYYADEAFSALRVVQDCGFEVIPLEEIVGELFYPNRFKRVYAKTEADGVPFLTASAMLHFRPTSKVFLTNRSDSTAICRVSPGLILVTRSGTVGRCVIVGNRLARFAISDDAIRIQAKDVLTGYLYAFLASRIGQSLLSKDQYGSAIKHLEPHHIAGVPIPLLPEEEQQPIHNEILRAYALRDEANDLLDEADKLLHFQLGLPEFDESLVPYLPEPPRQPTDSPEMPYPPAFTVKASGLSDRFDASYHIPITQTVISLLRKGNYPLMRLGQLAENIFIPPRFKRIYVQEKEHGVPFLRPSHLPQMHPYDLGYISKLTGVLDSLLLKNGDVLVTTDGTVGRVALVTSTLTGWAGSNNIGRITYGSLDGRNGYLAAFLSSPYGFYQLTREIYGGVIDHIEVPHLEGVWVPEAPLDVQTFIGQRVVAAFEKKGEATAIEAAAIQRLEALLRHSSE
jgi:type I restriction enzyme S subunit